MVIAKFAITTKQGAIEEKEVLNVVKVYSISLSLLDDYDHGCFSKQKGPSISGGPVLAY